MLYFTVWDATGPPFTLTNRASGKYMSVSVSRRNSRSRPLAHLSFVGPGDVSHVCGNRKAFQR